MSSQARIQANRKNAQKSTGPRTTAGKAASSRNSLKHGLCAQKFLLLDEDSGAYDALVADLFRRFRPVGQGEELIVLRMATTQWRLDRARAIETQIYRDQIAVLVATNPEASPAEAAAQTEWCGPAFMNDCAESQNLIRLSRYEAALERSLNHCLRQLAAFQKARREVPAEEPLAEPAGLPHPARRETAKRTQSAGPAPASAAPQTPANGAVQPPASPDRTRADQSGRTNPEYPI
ncbi:MAG TPA: hypothetical protein VMI94_29015 [Bryobacteraceae bacterium]|nr:hypothetical protein [Bryobacteraceae bacterium]